MFKPDLSVGKVSDDTKAGFFSIRLYVHNQNEQGQFNPQTHQAWKNEPAKRLTPYLVRVAIYQCENLPPADSNGTSDPYIEVFTKDKPKDRPRTKSCEDTNNPIFMEVKEFNLDFSDINQAPPVVL